MRLRTFLALLAVGACAALGLVACGGNDNGDASAGPAAAQATMPDDMAMADVDAMSPAAADLRVTLDSLLGEHALLAVAATQKGFDGAADFEAAAAALDANSVEPQRRSAPSTAMKPPTSSSTAPASGATTSGSSWTTRSRWPRKTRPASRKPSTT